MRLTNDIRDGFIDNVMQSIKLKSKWDKEKIIAEVERRFNAYWPTDVHQLNTLYPGLISMTSLTIDFMSLDYAEEPNWGKRHSMARVYATSKLEHIKTDDLEKHWAEYRKELFDRKVMRERIRQAVYSVNTDKALMELFPKLVKLIPKAKAPAKFLPVAKVSLTDELINMGLTL